jgi:hypothetical protein
MKITLSRRATGLVLSLVAGASGSGCGAQNHYAIYTVEHRRVATSSMKMAGVNPVEETTRTRVILLNQATGTTYELAEGSNQWAEMK